MQWIDQILQGSQFDYTFSVAIVDIIGTDDPAVVAILSGAEMTTVI
jgi:hypothetical protein